MNENLNLIKILKDCPKGTKLYSTIYGDVELVRVYLDDDAYPIEIKIGEGSDMICDIMNEETKCCEKMILVHILST